jgi:hypothetical protein
VFLHKYRAAIVACCGAACFFCGWQANSWRLGKNLEAQRADYAETKGRRGQAYADTLAQAALATSARIAEALLRQARAVKAKALAEAAQRAPTAPEYACRDKPLPDDYLETFRQ